MTFLEKIRELIANGRTEDSIDELLTYVKENNNELIDRIILLRSRMKDLNKSITNGTISEQDASLERARISESILKVISEIKPIYLKQIDKQHIYSSEKSKKKIFFILGLLLIFGIGYLSKESLFSKSEDIEEANPNLIQTLKGEYKGTLDKKELRIVFENINGNLISGYNIADTNKRPINGVCKILKENEYYVELREPGVYKWDGIFKITFTNETGEFTGRGIWESYDKKLFRKVYIKR